jgi:AcrR family transcriptional regulator
VLEDVMVDRDQPALRDRMLDAAEVVVVRQGIANLTIEAVAAEAGLSKGGLLHHFPNKDRLIEAMVTRAAENQRAYYLDACARAPEGPGRMARGVLANCLSDTQSWTDQLRRSSAAVFAALAHKPALIEPMRAVYSELYRRLEDDGLPAGAGEAIAAASDGLWLNWVLGLVPVDQARITRVRRALDTLLVSTAAAAPPSPSPPSRTTPSKPSSSKTASKPAAKAAASKTVSKVASRTASKTALKSAPLKAAPRKAAPSKPASPKSASSKAASSRPTRRARTSSEGRQS